MKVTRERNSYLNNIYPHTPHKFDFKLDTGKHYVVEQDGTQREISKIGTFRPKFRKDFTGFATPKDREEAAKTDGTALYFTPQNSFHKEGAYYTPMTRKYFGYAQQPYKIPNRKNLQHLDYPNEPHSLREPLTMKKSHSENPKRIRLSHKLNGSVILQHSATNFLDKKKNSDEFFEQSVANQITSKPLPLKIKKTCYNYRCKFQKNFVFDQRKKLKTTLWKTMFGDTRETNDTMRSKSFHDKQFELEKKEMSTMKSTFI